MIKQKFFAAEDGPINVLNHEAFFGILCFRQYFQELFFLGLCGIAGEGTQVSLFHDLLRRSFIGEELFQPIPFGGKFLVDGVSVGDVQYLGNAGLGGALAFARLFPIRSPESSPVKIAMFIGRTLQQEEGESILYSYVGERGGVSQGHRGIAAS